MLNVLSGYDAKDPFSVRSPKEDFTRNIFKSIKNKIIGIPVNFYFDLIDSEVQKVFDLSVQKLKDAGAIIEYIDLPYMDELSIAQQNILLTESYRTLEKHLKKTPLKIEKEVRNRAIAGMFIQASDYLNMLGIRH